MKLAIYMEDKEVYAFTFETEHIRNIRLALVQAFRLCLVDIYTVYKHVTHGDGKYLGPIATFANRINPDTQRKKAAEKKRREEEEEERWECQRAGRKS